MSGPMPVRASSASPSGMFTWLKNGGPTVTLVPWTSSDRIGNRVPHSTEKAIPMKSRLLNRKLASRLTIDSRRASAASNGSRLVYSAKLAVPATIRNARKKYPTLDCVNECTLEITPDPVMNVPKIDRSHYPMKKARFHFYNMPRQIPIERNSHDNSVHLRIATSQSVSSRRESSAAIANANGMVMEM